MRPKERIPIFLEKVNWKTLAERWNVDISLFEDVIICNPKLNKKIRKYWENNYDQRFGQVLINLGFMKDSLLIWNDEERDILDDQNIPKRETMLWGSIYDKDLNPLPKIKWRVIKDMTTDHIKAILKDVENYRMNINNDYLEVFKQEIELRKLN